VASEKDQGEKDAQSLLESQAPPAGSASGPPRRCAGKILKRVAVVALIVIPIAAIVYWYILCSLGSRDLESAIAEARAAGIATSYSDAYYQEWDDENAVMLLPDNAAWYYTQGYDLFGARAQARQAKHDLQEDFKYNSLPVIGRPGRAIELKDPIPRGTVESMRAFLAENADVFDPIHKGAAIERCRFPIHWDGPYTLLPHLTHTPMFARLVALEMWMYAEDNRPSDAVALVPDGLALGRAIAKEPLVISSLVSYSVYSTILSTGVERVLARTNPSNADLAALEEEFTRAADSLSSRQAVAGEIASAIDECARISEGRPIGFTYEDQREYATVRVRLLVWLEEGSIKRDFARRIRLLRLAAGAPQNPAPEMLTAGYLRALDVEPSHSRFEVGEADAWSSMSAVVLACERTRSKFRSAVACVAAMRYRNDHGKWPETLDALVPEYLPSVPLDPFTGKPIHYRVTDTGIAAYSIGQNLADDGGVFDLYSPVNPKDPKSTPGTADDTGFRVWKPAPPPQ
jgi:hypothetical protein